MEALRQDVLMCLRRVRQPQPPQQIAATVGAALADVYDELGYLVRHGAARRHHCDDAVMRYSGVHAVRKPPEITPHTRRERVRLVRPAPMADAVLSRMGAAPMRSREIIEACIGIATGQQVHVALQVLQRRGAVKKVSGATSNALWQRAAVAGGVGINHQVMEG
ncbi:hypothetical protein [Rhodanobacter lindaniclasticus]